MEIRIVEKEKISNNMSILLKATDFAGLKDILSPVLMKNRQYIAFKTKTAKDYEDGDNIFVDDDEVEFTVYYGFGHAHFSIESDNVEDILEASKKVLTMVSDIVSRKLLSFHCHTYYGLDFTGYRPALSDEELKKIFIEKSEDYKSYMTERTDKVEEAYLKVFLWGDKEITTIKL